MKTFRRITTRANILPSGAASVSYAVRVGRGIVHGAVFFDKLGHYEDATRCTLTTKGRGFCEIEQLPAGVYAAAKAARAAALLAAANDQPSVATAEQLIGVGWSA